MAKIIIFLKFIFHTSVIFLIVLSLYPGSLLGLLLYGDLGRQPNLIENPFGLSINHFQDIKGKTDLKTNINFDLSKQFKIENLFYSIEGDIPYLEIHTEEKRIIKEYFPEYDPKVIIKDADIKFLNSKSDHKIQLNGFIKTKGKFDEFKIKEFISKRKLIVLFKKTISIPFFKKTISILFRPV